MQAAKRNFRIQPGNPLWPGLLPELSAQNRGSSWLPARRLCLPGWNSELLKSRENKESSEGGGVSCRQLGSVPRRNVSCFRLELWVIVAIGLAMSSLLLLSCFSCVRLCATPWTAAHQAPPSLGFSKQEHRSGLPFPSPMHESGKWKWTRSVVSDSSWPHGLQPTRLLRPWDFPGKSTGVGCHRLLQMSSQWMAISPLAVQWVSCRNLSLNSSLGTASSSWPQTQNVRK